MGALADIHAALIDAGFEPRFNGKRNRYFGNLACAGRTFPVALEVVDKHLVKHPTITLLERPPEIPPVCAHISPNGDICYSTPGRDVLDLYRPGPQILACLAAAQSVLCKALRGNCLTDIPAEFHAYWEPQAYLLADLGTDVPDGSNVALFEMTRKGREGSLLLAARSAAAYEQAGYKVTTHSSRVYVTSAPNPPVPLAGDAWPPKTLGALGKWLTSTDGGVLHRAFIDAVHHFHGKPPNFVFLVRTPAAWWAVNILESDKAAFKHSALRWARHVRRYGNDWKVSRWLVERGDARYLLERNLGGRRGLAGKKILLAGIGTIGGFLADLLCRAGAGADGGLLLLCDPDVLLPGNIGRHYLGLEDLWISKSDTVRARLNRSLPHLNVQSTRVDARSVNLSDFDLVVDATGSEAVSLALNQALLDEGCSPPALYVWNEGGGVATQCLLVDSPKTACYRCLWDEERRPRFSPLREPTSDRFIMGTGCDSAYIPYPAMVSMHAAAMASGLILDWADGRPGRRFRSITVDHKEGKIVKDGNPERHSRCPACS